MVYPVPINEAITTKSQRYNCFMRNGGNAISKHACPEAEGSNPTIGLALLWHMTHSEEILITGESHKKVRDH
jgi:hypothetical protein